ncbi:sodium/bile acid cotransporter 4 [Paralichthys olivaceus]|uniref:sodium/bile acid cotransporter 4 n=1 Tax=Paralichthys olivaceus TaxID=8255 RepID=UPI00097E142A|nr:PREDICTED: sodium/bile acid cotransporter 4 isoform X1 [Paralichthys olivaceus]XP_019967123.1 PREDICTED: sodium/bile acid cotransporter 4-like isoform X1 [Paralichthys olivaceus]
MENSSLFGGDAQRAGLIDFPMLGTLKRVLDFPKDGAAAGSGVAGGVMILEGGTLRTAAGDGVDFMAAPPTESPHLVPAFWDSPLNHGINVFVGLVLCFTMLGLGCTVEVSQIGEHIRRPIGVLLALVCQFVIMPLVAFLLALAFSLNDVAAMAVLLCGCCPGGNLSNIMSLLVHGEMNLSIIMTISSTLLALVLMPLCLWIYSRAWINTPVVNLMPFGAIILTLCSTLIPIGLGVTLRYRYTRVADIVLKASLWSLLVTLILLFILTGAMLGPDLLSTIPLSVYVVAILMPLCGYAAGYGLAVLFNLPPNSCRSVSMETGCQNVQLCTAILKLAFPPQLMGGMYMFPLLYALFQAAEAGIFILAYRIYRKEVLHKPDPTADGEDITYQRFHDDEDFDSSYGAVTVSDPNTIMLDPCPPDPTPV